MMPTFAELAGATAPASTDGVSLVPSLVGRDGQRSREYLYWEFQGRQAVWMKNWKAVRLKPSQPVELYDLATDPAERTNVSAAHPDLVARVTEIFRTGRTESALFPLGIK